MGLVGFFSIDDTILSSYINYFAPAPAVWRIFLPEILKSKPNAALFSEQTQQSVGCLAPYFSQLRHIQSQTVSERGMNGFSGRSTFPLPLPTIITPVKYRDIFSHVKFQISFGVNMSSKGNAPNRRVAAIQAKKKRKQPKKSKQGEGQNANKDRERNRDKKPEPTVEVDKNRSFEEVSVNVDWFPVIFV